MTVYLVGAGPGDPGLITVRGLELVRECDAIVYDRLVSPELVGQAPLNAVRIARDRLGQSEVDELLVRLGRRGLDVVRLKGGDPFVFGRGGEEALALAAAGIPFAMVPGVSSIAAVPASAGIPVTHRGLSSQVTVVSGHDPDELDFASLAGAPGTLVFFMGLASLAVIAGRLLAAEKPAETPVAVISQATTSEERSVVAPLAAIAEAATGLEPPALVVVGDVVRFASEIGPNMQCGIPEFLARAPLRATA